MMPTLVLDAFSGEIPRLKPHFLPDGAAQVAINCDFTSGDLRPLSGLGAVWNAHSSAQPVRSLFTDNGLRFFAWDVPTRAMLAPTIDDTARRVYYQSHGLGIRMAQTDSMLLSSQEPRAPTQSWAAGVKAPVSAPTLTLVGTSTGTNIETRAYKAVAINIWGEISAGSPPAIIEVPEGQDVQIDINHTADADQVPLQGLIFYRTYESNSTVGYLLIDENATTSVALPAYTYTDTTTSPQTSTALVSDTWEPAPVGAGNMSYAGNGSLCASIGKDLVFTEPYKPHAWAYRMTFPHGIVGVLEMDGALLVTTQKQSYLVSGAHPSQMSQTPLAVNQAGWSDTALADIDGSGVYAGNDGLVSVYGGQPNMDSTRELFRRKDWRNAYGGSRLNLRLKHHDGLVLGLVDPSYPVAATESPFLINLDASPRYYTRINAGESLYSASVSGTTDQLLIGTATGAGEFGKGSAMSMTWHSKEYRYPAPVSFSAGEIDCEGALTVEFIADGVTVQTIAASGFTEFRFDDHNPAWKWSVRVTGTGSLTKIAVGPSFDALKGA